MMARIGSADVARLAINRALTAANPIVVYAAGTIIGHGLAAVPTLSTLPMLVHSPQNRRGEAQ